MNRFLHMLVVLLLPFLITACNTMAGAGEDIARGGEELEESAEEHKNY